MDINTCAAGLTENIRTIAYYTHLVPTALALFLGIYALLKTKYSKLSIVFFLFTLSFSIWLIGDLISWGVFSNYNGVYSAWAILDYVNVVFFMLGAYFFSILARGKVTISESVLMFIICLPAFFITIFGHSLIGFDQSVCEAFENNTLTQYKLYAEIASVAFIIYSYFVSFRISDKSRKIKLTSVLVAILLFFVVFSYTEFIATITNVYEINLYGLFVLPVFLIIMVFSITNLGVFPFRFLGTQILSYTLIIVTGSQLLYLQNSVDLTLTVITVAVSAVLAMLLLQNAKREEEAREKIESLASDLEKANDRQESLIHFISHEVKGFLTKNLGVFAGIKEGDYGATSPELKTTVEYALGDTQKGVETVMDILNASNLKKGTTTYKMMSFDLKQSIEYITQNLKAEANQKGLIFNLNFDRNLPENFVGDREQLEKHVFRNLIDNAIKYTLKGEIAILLTKKDNSIIFSVKDSGVGITLEDKKRLFTEGGRGVNSILTNVNSTGYGLFIAKSIVEAHKGRIWAESGGKNSGSTFYVELPIVAG